MVTIAEGGTPVQFPHIINPSIRLSAFLERRNTDVNCLKNVCYFLLSSFPYSLKKLLNSSSEEYHPQVSPA